MSIASEIVRIKNAKEAIREQLERYIMDPDGTKLENFISNFRPLYGDENGEWYGTQPSGSNIQFTQWDCVNTIPDLTLQCYRSGLGATFQRSNVEYIGNFTATPYTANSTYDESRWRDIFGGATRLKYIKGIHIVVPETYTNVSIRGMFDNTTSLKEVPPIVFSGSVNPLNITDSYQMFYKSAVETIPELVGVSLITSMDRTFYNSGIVDAENLTKWLALTDATTKITALFQDSSKLKYVPDIYFEGSTGAAYLFRNCQKLEHVGDINMPNVTSSSYMLYDVGKESEQLQIGNIILPKCTNLNDRLMSVYHLKSLGYIECGQLTSFSIAMYVNQSPDFTEFGGWKDLGKSFTTSTVNGINVYSSYLTNINKQSILNIFNQVFDLTSAGKVAQRLNISNINSRSELTDSDIAIATNKGWTVVM